MMTVLPVRLNETKDALILLDQTLLPEQEQFLTLDTPEAIWEAIQMLRVRGAPAIGIAAALGLYVCTARSQAASVDAFAAEFNAVRSYLATARPTAVNLFWALDRMTQCLQREWNRPVAQIKQALLAEAEQILAEDQQMGRAIGEFGLSVLRPDMGLLTHCNAGGLATSGYGTALAPMYLGQTRGYNFRVYADETRPLLQGARLTAYELDQAGIDVTVICDNMAASVMQAGYIDAVLVGCDRVAANGDTANKIGTAGLAVLAQAFAIPFYVLGPTSTIDANTPTGAAIEIERRDEDEISCGFGRRTVPSGVKTFNPAFDVTPAAYITAIITEKGISYPPYEQSLQTLAEEE